MSSTIVDVYTKTTENNTEKHYDSFEFTGNASEYFKIWIVNVCLSILTLGIYSAWAKVRTTRYFYGNTSLAGASFDYIAKPENILKGRLIAALFFAIWYGISSYAPMYEYIFIIIMGLITPWLMVKALSFRASNTTYRNIQFNFQGTYSRAMVVYWGYLLFVTILTLGLAYPWALNKKQKYIINHSAYGSKRFSFSSCTGEYYAIIIRSYFLAAILIAVVFGIFQKMDGYSTLLQVLGSGSNSLGWFAMLVLGVPYMISSLFIGTYTKTENTNCTLSAIKIDQLSLHCDLSVTSMIWLYSSNIIAIICSAGLLIPWAKIRTHQYKMSCLKLNGLGGLDDFIASSTQDQKAIGEGIADIFDVEIGL